MARGGRLPRTAGRPPRFLRTGHRRATSLSEAHLQAAQRDAGHTLGREAEGVLQSLLFDRASRGLRAQRATFSVLVEGDPDVDAALASAVGCSPPPRSLTPPRAPLSDPEGPCCAAAAAAALPRLSDTGSAAAVGAAAALVLASSGAPGLRRAGRVRPSSAREPVCPFPREPGKRARRWQCRRPLCERVWPGPGEGCGASRSVFGRRVAPVQGGIARARVRVRSA